MELKTKITADEGRQDLWIDRTFNLPVNLLYKAYTDASIIEQWMGTKVVNLENKDHGSFRFETTDPTGHVHIFHGSIHEVTKNVSMVRTFQMQGFPAQLEFLEFIPLNEEACALKIHTIFKSNDVRDRLLQLPFAFGISMAHDRIEHFYKNINH